MKRFLFGIAAITILSLYAGAVLTGCEQKDYANIEEAVRDSAVLGDKITIDGTDVSGMEVLDARKLLAADQQARITQLTFEVHVGEESVSVSGSALGLRYNLDEVLAQAASLPSPGPFQTEVRQLQCTLSAKGASAARQAEKVAETLYQAPINAEVKLDPDKNGFHYIEDQAGFEVNITALASQLSSAAATGESAHLEAPILPIEAEYTLVQAREDTQLISEFTTSFQGSVYGKKNRVHNIVKAAELLDGKVVEPGDIFSMNEVLGPRNEENGWAIAAGILDGAYVQEYGGGVCQVSTTLYNALLMADLTITDRSHHSWPLGYVAAGRDATISTGGPDLRFENTSGARLFLRAETDEKEKTVTVRIYGRPLPDGVSISLSSEKIKTLEDLGTEVVVDPTLAEGEEEVVREARVGCVAVTWKEYHGADGSLIRKEQVTKDVYRSIRGLIKIAPAAAGTPQPTQPPQTPEASPSASFTPEPSPTEGGE